MEEGGGERRVCPAFGEHVVKIFRPARAARGDDGHVDGIRRRAREREVVAGLCAVFIHAGEQHLPRAEGDRLFYPAYGVEPGIDAAAVEVDIPRAAAVCLCVYREHHALRSELCRRLTNEGGVLYRCGVDGDLVCPGGEHGAEIFDAADAAAHRERDEYLLAGAAQNIDGGLSAVAGRGYVEKDDLVGADLVIRLCDLNGISRVDEVDEIDALDHPALIYIEAGNDALCEQVAPPPPAGARAAL